MLSADTVDLAALLTSTPSNDNGAPTPAPLREKSRRPNAPTAIRTPEEFFRDPRTLRDVSYAIARRFVRRAPFLNVDDVAQDAAEEILKCRLPHRWQAAAGVPFGGYAWRSAIMKLTGKMWTASVPVSGTFSSLAEVAAIGALSLDAPRAGEEDGDAAGERIAAEDLDPEGPCAAPESPETAAERSAARAVLAYALRGYGEEVAFTLLDLLHGMPAEALPAGEIPAGWTRHGLVREAAALRARLTGETAPAALELQGEAADGDAPWVAL